MTERGTMNGPPDTPVLIDTMAIPAPAGPGAQAVLARGGRAVVRASDGTGCAARHEVLVLL